MDLTSMLLMVFWITGGLMETECACDEHRDEVNTIDKQFKPQWWNSRNGTDFKRIKRNIEHNVTGADQNKLAVDLTETTVPVRNYTEISTLPASHHGSVSEIPNGDSTFDKTTQEGGFIDFSSISESNTTSSDFAIPVRKTPKRGVLPPIVNEGLISKQAYKLIEKTFRYMTYATQIVAIILCSFSIVIFSRKELKSPTSTYIIGLNVTELLTIISSSCLVISGFIFGDKAFVSYDHLFIGLYVTNYFAVATRRCTFCITCLVAAERFIAVAFPLKSKLIKLVRNPSIFIISTVISSLVFHSFSALKYNIVSFTVPGRNETLWRFQFTEIYMNNKSSMKAWSKASKIMFVYLQLIGCLVLNIGIVLALRRHKMKRQQLTVTGEESTVHKEKQTTIMILIATFVFVLLALPINTSSLVANLDSNNYGINTKNHYLFFSLFYIGGFFELLSDCTNFIFYMVLSSQFRKTFIKMFCSPCLGSSTTSVNPYRQTRTTQSQMSDTSLQSIV